MKNYTVTLTRQDYTMEIHEFDDYSDAMTFLDNLYTDGYIGYSDSTYIESEITDNIHDYNTPYGVM